MRRIFIGDVQGCCNQLERLLDKLAFDPAGDYLHLVGDLVNRGGQSLETLRLLHKLGDSAVCVLGNHDLHLLAYASAHPRVRKKKPEFEAIINAPDGQTLLTWLRHRPLMWASRDERLAMVHAGVDPRWGPKQARARASELELTLTGGDHAAFFRHMYGDTPRRWKPRQPHWKRMRAITNVFTRMRFCDAKGRLEFESKGAPGTAPKGFKPWFEFLHQGWRDWTLVFGHWSMLGLYRGDNVVAIDTGCVWGRKLTAFVVDGQHREFVQIKCKKK